MASTLTPLPVRVVAFFDIGTNSIRLLLVRINANHSTTILSQQKEIVRLGENEFGDEEMLQPDAMERAALVVARFAALARAYEADEMVAVATAATREAKNQAEFLHMLKRETDVEVRVISGREEARLVYLGVSSGTHLADRRVVFIDIGGGSCEVILGSQHEYEYLDMFKLGAIRLTSMFFLPNETDPVPPARYALIKQYVRNSAIRAIHRIKAESPVLAVGSSGTIMNLADVAVHMISKRRLRRDDEVTLDQLRQAIQHLMSLPLEERRRVPGLNPERADIIIAGAAVLETLLEEFGIQTIRISDRGLRDGLLVDYLARLEVAGYAGAVPVRERSVIQLGRSCGFDETHCRQAAYLAEMLFDAMQREGLHRMGAYERELLRYACMLHDVGTFLSYSNHHLHSYYIIRNADLLGFDLTDQAIIAVTALFHRKAWPRKRSVEFASLPRRSRRIVRQLCVLLRLAESLDRSHSSLITTLSVHCPDKRTAVLEAQASGDAELEMWGAMAHEETFARAFGRRLVVQIAPAADNAPTVNSTQSDG